MKNGDVLTLYETLDRISKDKDLKIDVQTGYIMAKNKMKLKEEAQLIYNMRRDIIMEHGIVDGKGIKVATEYIDETNEKINQLMNIENEISITQISIDAFKNQKLNMEDIEGLMLMVYESAITSPPIFN